MNCKFKTAIANKNNYGNSRNTANIKYIVIHYTGNDGDTDEANAKYFQNNIVKASAHYFVDDDSVTQSVPDNYVAWSVGGSKYANCNHTGGGKYYRKCTNANSISVELCDVQKDGVSNFSKKTINNAIDLIKLLMAKYNVDTKHIIRHFDVTGKICPKPFINDVNLWQKFKMRLTEEIDMEEVERLKAEIESLKTQFAENTKMYNYISEMPDWAIKTINKLYAKGIIKGVGGERLELTMPMIRLLVINDNAGMYD